MKSKRGQGLSTNAIILIILGVVVLVVLIVGFTVGWNKLLPFVSTNNVENIKTGCTLACTTGNVYDFCTQSRTLKADDPNLPDGKATSNCFDFSNPEGQYVRFGIGSCPSITCPTQ